MKKHIVLKVLFIIVLLICTAALVISNILIVIPKDTAVAAEIWNGTDGTTVNSVSTFSGGSGTSSEPYQISTPGDLAQLATNVNAGLTAYKSAYYIMTADIKLNDETFAFDSDTGLVSITDDTYTAYLGTHAKGDTSGSNTSFDSSASTAGATYSTNIGAAGSYYGSVNTWTPVGTDTNYFMGNFNGNGFTVSGLYINSTTAGKGMFGYSNSQANLSNITLSDSYIRGVVNTGGLVGQNNGIITNCHNSATVIGYGNNNTGGIAGYNYSEKIKYCYNTGVISGSSFIGGITSDTYGEITNCYNSGLIYSDGGCGGGILGRNFSTVSNCYNTGNILGYATLGGICGQNEGTLSNCYNSATVKGTLCYVGGVVGYYVSGSIANCYYLTGCAKDNVNFTQSGIGTGTSGTANTDNVSQTAAFNAYGVITTNKTIGTYTGLGLRQLLNAWVYSQSTPSNYSKWINSPYPVFGEDTRYFAGGSGTTADPYLINNAEQLMLLSDIINSGRAAVVTEGGESVTYTVLQYACYKLTSDIAFNNESITFEADTGLTIMTDGTNTAYLGTGIKGTAVGSNTVFDSTASIAGTMYINKTGTTGVYAGSLNFWLAIGTNEKRFNGSFDGDGYAVSSIYCNTTTQYQGLFGMIGTGSKLTGIRIADSYIKATSEAGGISGYNIGTITDCLNSSTVVATNYYAGGIAGFNNSGTIINCGNTGAISGGYSGGIFGYDSYGIISNCYSTGTVYGGNFIGGIFGCGNYTTINNCYNAGTVKGTMNYAGAVAGYIYNGTMSKCYYLTGSAKDGSNVVQYGIGTSSSSLADTTGSTDPFNIYGVLVSNKTIGTYTGINLRNLLNAWIYTQTTPSNYSLWTNNLYPDFSEDTRYFAGGSGTTGDPYLIDNAEQLGLLSDIINNGRAAVVTEGGASVSYENLQKACYKLTSDIVLNNETFTFDADTGLTVMTDGTNTAYLGTGIKGTTVGSITAFDSTASVSGTVYVNKTGTTGVYAGSVNFWLAIGITNTFNGSFDGDGYTVSGIYINTTINYQGLFGVIGTLGQVKNTGVINSYLKGFAYIGGVAGANSGSLTDSYNSGIITSPNYQAGGVLGTNWSIIQNCNNSGVVVGIGYTGGVIGYNDKTVLGCYNTGSAYGESYVGGIIGYNTCNTTTVRNCYNTGNITGYSGTGGIVGYNYGMLYNCYNSGYIRSNYYTGGIAGDTLSGNAIYNCYNTGTVKSAYSYVGAIVGQLAGTVTNCYYLTGSASDGSNVIQFGVGYYQGSTTADVSGKTDSFNKYGIFTADKTVGSYTGKNLLYILNAWVYNQTVPASYSKWANNSYPVFRSENTYFAGGSGTTADPYLISDALQLDLLAEIVNCGRAAVVVEGGAEMTYAYLQAASYKLTANIVLNDEIFTFDEDTGLVIMTDGTNTAYLGTEIKGTTVGSNTTFDTTASVAGTIYTNKTGTSGVYAGSLNAWFAIGTQANMFKGSFDGSDYTISGIYINSTVNLQGLFGYGDNTGSQIENAGIINGYLKGCNNLGSFAGYFLGNITNCYNTATIINNDNFTGGITAYSGGIIQGCYNTGNIFGGVFSGGITGRNDGTIDNCYNTGNIFNSADSNIGGIAGTNRSLISNSYNTGNITGTYSSAGGIAGSNDGQILNCYNTGNLSTYTTAGGIAGVLSSGTVDNCYSTGTITGYYYIGGVIGSITGGVVSNCYYLTGSAKNSNNIVQYGVGNSSSDTSTADITGKTNAFDTSAVLSATLTVGGYMGTSLLEALNAYVLADSNNLTKWVINTEDTYPTMYSRESVILYTENGTDTIYVEDTIGYNDAFSDTLYEFSAPTRAGYIFAGYYTAEEEGLLVITADGTVVLNIDGYTDSDGNWTISGTAILYAYWELDEPEITDLSGYTGVYDCESHNTSVTVTQYIPYTFQWYFGSVELANLIEGATAYTLSVKYVIQSGNYYCVVTANDGVSTVSVTSDAVAVTITQLTIAEPVASGSYTYNGSVQTVTLNGFDSDKMSVSGNIIAEAGAHTAIITLTDDNYKWADGSDGSVEWSIGQAELNEPVLSGSYTYSGSAQTVTLSGFDSEIMSVTGNIATNAGTHSALILITDANYKWADGIDAQVDWTIAQATNSWVTTLSITGWTYGGATNEYIAEPKFGEVIFTYSDSENGTYTSPEPDHAGIWYVKANVAVTANYTELESSASFEIAKASQTIVGTTLYNVTFGDIDFSLDMTAQTAVTYTLATGGSIITLNDNLIFIKSYGTATVQASAASGINYEAAQNVIITINIAAAGTVSEPENNLTDGSIDEGGELTVFTATEDAIIYYTDDGSTPTTSSTVYTGAIIINSDITIKAFASKTGYYNSPVSEFIITLYTYTLEYDGNGSTDGVANVETNLSKGDTATVLTKGTLVKTGYTFSGWNTQADGMGTTYAVYATFTMDTANTTLWAVWAINTYTLTYNGNGNTDGAEPFEFDYEYDSVISISDEGSFLRTGYSFNGWNTEFGGGGIFYTENAEFNMPAENTTLWAVWTINSYSLTYYGNGNSGGAVPADTQFYNYNTVVTVLGNIQGLTRTGNTFVGWNTKFDGTGTDYIEGSIFNMPSEIVELYAIWSVNSYNVTYYGNGNSSGTAPVDAIQHNYDTAVGVLSAGTLVKTGYIFDGWNTLADGTGDEYLTDAIFYMPAVEVKLYAVWEAVLYTVTYHGNGNESGSAPLDGNTYIYENSVIIAGNPGLLAFTGYDFNGWNTAWDGSGNDYAAGSSLDMPNGNVDLYANWVEAKFTIIYNGNGNSDGVAPENAEVIFESQATISNQNTLMKTGYLFDGWNTESNGGGTDYATGFEFTMPAEDIYLYAQWAAINYNVIYNGNENTGGDVPTDADNYIYLQSVTLLANYNNLAKTGYVFSGWNTATDGSGSDYSELSSFNMPADNVTLYAKWVLKKSTVAYNGTGNTGGSVPAAPALYDYNVEVTVSGNTGSLVKNGYAFVGWNTTADATVTISSFIMPETDVTLFAIWEAIPADILAFTFTDGTYNSVYNCTLDYATGGSGNYSYTITDGNLPSGLHLSGNAVTGTPLEVGTFIFEITVADNVNGTTAADDYFIYVDVAGTVETPVAIPGSGAVDKEDTVVLTALSDGAVIYYTVDGSEPTTASTLYSGEIAVTADVTIKAFAVKYGYTDSAISTFIYTVKKYALEYNGNGNTEGTVPEGATMAKGETVEAAAAGTLVRSGYTFGGWNTAVNGTGTAYATDSAITMGTAAITLYAHWISLAVNLVGSALSEGTCYSTYAVTISATGGSGDFSYAVSGVLPNGLSLDSETGEISGTVTAASGNYSFTINVTDDINSETDSADYSIKVNKASQAISGTTVYNITWGDGEISLNLTAATVVTYIIAAGNEQITLNGVTVDIIKSGTASITASAATDNYYEAAENVTVTINIAKADASITINTESIVYDGAAVEAFDISYNYDGDGNITIIWYADNAGTRAEAISAPVNAGAYWAGVSAAEGDNYNGVAEIYKQITINKATYNMSDIALANSTVTYDGTSHSLAISGLLPSGVSVSYTNNGQTEAGSYTIIASFAGDADNFNLIDEMSATLTINPSLLSITAMDITAASKTYTGNVLVWVNGDFTAPIHTTVESTAEIAEQNYTIVGSPAITVMLKADSNHTFGTIAADTCEFTVTLTIDKATYNMSGISFADGTVTYDGTSHSLAISGTLPEGVSVTYANNGKTVVGDYTITASFAGDSANYSPISVMNATLTIEPALLSFTGSSILSESKTYSGATLIWSVDDLTVPDYTSIENIDVISEQNYILAGTPDIMITLKADSNHTFGTTAADTCEFTVTLTIDKATYNMSDIAFVDGTVTYDGISHSLAISGTLPEGVSVTYANNGKTVVGDYTITASFAGDSANYSLISAMNATLTIEPALLSFTGTSILSESKTYSGATQIWSVEELTAPDCTSIESIDIISEQNYILAGSPDISVTLRADSNHTFGTVARDTLTFTVTLTIDKATYNMSGISFADGTVTYDGASHSLAISGTLPSGVSVNYANNGKTAVGEYTITASFAGDSDNFNSIPDMEAELTIDKHKLTEPSVTGSYTYTGSSISVSLSEFDTGNISIASGNTAVNAGVHTVLLTITDATKYEWADGSDGSIDWNIGQATNTWSIIISIADWNYGNTPAVPSAVATFGIVNYTYSDTENGIYASSVPVNADIYWVKASVEATNNYTELVSKTSFVIEKTVLTDTTKNISAVYDGVTHTINIELIGYMYSDNITNGEITYGTQEGNYTSAQVALKNAGSITVYYKLEFDNYATITGSKTINVTKRTVHVIIDNKSSITGAGLASLTYSIAPDAASVVEGDTLNIALTKVDGEEAGLYGITGSYDNSDYTVIFTDGIYTLKLGQVNVVLEQGSTVTVSSEEGFEPVYQLVVTDYKDENIENVLQAVVLTYKDYEGNNGALSGDIRVSIELGALYNDGDIVKVMRLGDDGAMTEVECVVEDGKVSFNTDELGAYAVIWEENMDYDGYVLGVIAVFALSVTIAISITVGKLKKRLKKYSN